MSLTEFTETKTSRDYSIIRRAWVLLVLAMLVQGAGTAVYASHVTLAWAPSANSDVLFYKVFCRQAMHPFDYDDPAWMGTRPKCTISGLDEATPYCFVVRAVDIYGNESDNSNEACWSGSDGTNNTTLIDMFITGPDSVYEDSAVHYTANAVFGDGSIQSCTNDSSWEDDSRYGTVNEGMLITSSVTADETITISASYVFGNVVKSAQKTITVVDNPQSDSPPQEPTVVSPYNKSGDVSLVPELLADGYFDPNGDNHSRSHWQISMNEDDFSEEALVFEADTAFHLTSLVVPRLVLDEECTYYWRVRFGDSMGEWSDWSETVSFTTPFSWQDVHPRNGIPDHQDVGDTVDIDENKIPDINQNDILTLNTAEGNGRMGVKVHGNVTITALESYRLAELIGPGTPPYEMTLGAIGFKLLVPEPGDIVEVDVLLSEPAPTEASWFKYDSINGWNIYQLTVVSIFSDDRKRVRLRLQDGGYGDADGVRNGVIVDPGGVGSSVDNGGHSSGDGGAGCFVESISCGTGL